MFIVKQLAKLAFTKVKLRESFVVVDKDSYRMIGFFFDKDHAQYFADYMNGLLPVCNGDSQLTINARCPNDHSILMFLDTDIEPDVLRITLECPHCDYKKDVFIKTEWR